MKDKDIFANVEWRDQNRNVRLSSLWLWRYAVKEGMSAEEKIQFQKSWIKNPQTRWFQSANSARYLAICLAKFAEKRDEIISLAETYGPARAKRIHYLSGKVSDYLAGKMSDVEIKKYFYY